MQKSSQVFGLVYIWDFLLFKLCFTKLLW